MKRFLGIVALVCSAAVSPWAFQQGASTPSGVPAYHDAAPGKGEKLPPIMTQKELADQGLTAPAQQEAYKAAAKLPAVMHQLPCYCFCDRHAGHNSLHSCFESPHGANCGTCMAEALYAYQMSKKGWSVKMIRDSIMKGDYKTTDLQKPEPVL
ncbi:MAG TPA: CYCXC family (seleno)protein [Candidatus Angelobacter sp.]|nr:CYCXC family (seleno)protein [Candidatus Angelobacter sp.]